MSIPQDNQKYLAFALTIFALIVIIFAVPKTNTPADKPIKEEIPEVTLNTNPTPIKTQATAIPQINKKVTFTYSVWLPFWKKTNAVQEVSPYLKKISTISPFSYEVKTNGTLIDRLKIDNAPWAELFSDARNLKVKIVPTIAWFDGEAIHNILSQPEQMEKHVLEIITIVTSKNFDGIDINYENKKAETIIYFSQFLADLSKELHKKNKVLICSIEARTPLSSRFVKIPEEIKYANDYKIINQYCDEVRILAYDQENIDLLLNKEKGKDKLYAPVADIEWVEKVIQEALKTIKPSKIVLAVATYGYEYQIEQKNNTIAYDELRSVTYAEATKLAKDLNIIPERNSAGELSFTYIKDMPATTTSATMATSTRLVWFTDASAISGKIKLAKKYNLQGIILFKLDGETDPKVWELF